MLKHDSNIVEENIKMRQLVADLWLQYIVLYGVPANTHLVKHHTAWAALLERTNDLDVVIQKVDSVPGSA